MQPSPERIALTPLPAVQTMTFAGSDDSGYHPAWLRRSGVDSAATASTLATRDSSANLTANNFNSHRMPRLPLAAGTTTTDRQ